MNKVQLLGFFVDQLKGDGSAGFVIGFGAGLENRDLWSGKESEKIISMLLF